VRCGGNWKRDYGDSYTGTQGETPDTAKEPPTDYRASSRPYQQQTKLRKTAEEQKGVLINGAEPVRRLPMMDVTLVRQGHPHVYVREKK
jgi:hypothetical protein